MPAESAIELLRSHGPLALVLLMLLNRLGIIPLGILILLTTGALVRQGEIAFAAAFVAAYCGTLLGDTAMYGAGRYGLGWLRERQARRGGWARAAQLIERWGVPAIFFTRWLLLPLTIATSLICGANQFRYRSFLLWGALGNLCYTLLFMGLGFRFNQTWARVLAWASQALDNSTALIVILALLVLSAVVYRRVRLAYA